MFPIALLCVLLLGFFLAVNLWRKTADFEYRKGNIVKAYLMYDRIWLLKRFADLCLGEMETEFLFHASRSGPIIKKMINAGRVDVVLEILARNRGCDEILLSVSKWLIRKGDIVRLARVIESNNGLMKALARSFRKLRPALQNGVESEIAAERIIEAYRPILPIVKREKLREILVDAILRAA